MTNTRYGKIRTNTITTPYPHSITINTRTVHAIKSNSDINTSPNYSVYRGVLPKTKCKSLFSRHFMFTLIVILASFTFTDMVNGKWFILICYFIHIRKTERLIDRMCASYFELRFNLIAFRAISRISFAANQLCCRFVSRIIEF